ncbi:hypothetical protein ABEB36_012524 [Hypothenemus hampei]|uniref:Uncharacterized protein n=1 Tax=Hypothenemus hampei TaxID=57062 RepID=A0ABD1EBS6_HYPHA
MIPSQLLQRCHTQLKMPSKEPFFKSARKYFRDYSDLSSIHGVKYLGENRTTVERGWWLVVFLFSLICCFYSIYLIYEKWNNSPVIISYDNDETPINQIPFPAVTICPVLYSNTDSINSDSWRFLTGTEFKLLFSKNLLCGPLRIDPLTKSKNFSFDDNFVNPEKFNHFISRLYITSYFENCLWQNEDLSCAPLFDYILTNDGICSSFNLLSPKRIYQDNVKNYFFHRLNNKTYDRSSNWSLDRGYSDDSGRSTYPRRMSFSSATNGLSISFKRDTRFKSELKCPTFWILQGFKVFLHTPSSVPVNQEYFYLPLNTAITGAIKPVVLNTLEKVKNSSPEKRKCYFENEGSLKYFKEYTQSNCELDCLTRYTLYWCGCVAFYMPMDNVTTICGTGKNKCMKEAEEKMHTNELIIKQNHTDVYEKPPQCYCLPSCRDLSYEVQISSGINMKSDPYHLYSTLVLYFKKNQFIASNRHELYGFTDFLGNLGALLALFIGFSVLSFMEIIYFLTVRILYNIRLYGQWWGKKNEKSNSQNNQICEIV